MRQADEAHLRDCGIGAHGNQALSPGNIGERLDLRAAVETLGNDKFVNNAPADVVTQERQRAVDFEKTIAQLDEQLEKLAELT